MMSKKDDDGTDVEDIEWLDDDAIDHVVKEKDELSDEEDEQNAASSAEVGSIDILEPRPDRGILLQLFKEVGPNYIKRMGMLATFVNGIVLEERARQADRKLDKLLDASDKMDDRTIRMQRSFQDMMWKQEQQFQAVMNQVHSTWKCLNERIAALEQKWETPARICANNVYVGSNATVTPAVPMPPHMPPFLPAPRWPGLCIFTTVRMNRMASNPRSLLP